MPSQTSPLTYVFVYGTLKPGEVNYWRYCAEKVLNARPAIALGKLFDFPSLGYPGMTLGEEPVYGFVLTFADPDILSDLDRLEDYQPQRDPAENEYERCQINVFDLEGQPLEPAWVYLMQPQQIEALGGIWLPEGSWKQTFPLH